MTSVLPFDELNQLTESIRQRFADGLKKEQEEDIIDELLDLFMLSYARAVEVTNEYLASFWKPNYAEVMKVVDAEVADETWRQRVEKYFSDGGTADDIIRIAETESHRIANTAALDAARKGGATQKTWSTMLDDRVRTTHDYLEGVTVGIDDDFITYTGAKGQAPGMFGTPEEDCNCRCELIFS